MNRSTSAQFAKPVLRTQKVIDEWIEVAQDMGRLVPAPKGRFLYA